MPNATGRANARALPEANRRVVLGGVLAAATLAAIPAGTTEAAPEAEPELQALIAAWNESHRRLEETYDASCAADERAQCPVPQALITTESDAKFWSDIVPGKHFQRKDVDGFRALTSLTYRLDDIFSCDGYDDRAAEIIASWDSWQAEQKAANEREGVAEADALWSQAVENYHAMGHRLAKLQAKTMVGVIAKLLAAASRVTEDELDDDAHFSVLAGAALDAQVLMNARGEDART
jgi:hypothetical protein